MVANALAPLTAQTLLTNPSQFETYSKLAHIIVTSQLAYGKTNKPEEIEQKQRDIFLLMLKGLEIGMLPMQALDSIDVISGKPAIKPQGMLALIKSKGALDWMKIVDDGVTCTVTMKRKGEAEPYTESFGMTDADMMTTTEWVNGSKRTIKLSEKHNWKAQPKTMRKWRAVAACCRTAFPDLIQGMYTPEELGADVMMSDDGDEIVIEHPSPTPTTTPPTTPVPNAPTNVITMPQAGEPTTDPTPQPEASSAEIRENMGQRGKLPTEQNPNGTVKRESYPATGPSGEMIDWANENNIGTLISAVNARIPGIQGSEIVRLAGVQSLDDYYRWNEKFTSGKRAVAAILAAWEAEQTPATPKAEATTKAAPWTGDEITIFANWLETHFGLTLGAAETAMDTVFHERYKSPIDAMTAVVTRATEERWNVITTTAYYNGDYIEFETVCGRIRVYGRSTAFKGTVGASYYVANEIEKWEADSKPKPVTPLLLRWDAKVSDKGGAYNLSDKGKQTPVVSAPVGDLADVPF